MLNSAFMLKSKAMADIDPRISQAEKSLEETWRNFEEIKHYNQIKVLKAFQKAGIQNSHYSWVTGYGYDDLGKDKLDELYAHYFNTEAAIVRLQLVSGTHAISCAVLGNLNAGDELVAVTGKPYDTLQSVFKKFVGKYNIGFKEGEEELSSNTKLAFLQRSRGYEWRDSYGLDYLKRKINLVREKSPNAVIFVDNCYGEFTQIEEPTDIGADIIAGSLIKNPGAGIVAAGAYIAGKKEYVENAAEVLTAPGIGTHGGCSFDQNRLMMQGFFLAPNIVYEALRGMSLASRLFQDLGLETIPAADAERNDIIQAIKFNSRERLIKFCELVQKNSPVNSMFSPVPDAISGYDDEIIMAAGAFVEGSSIELSADGPLREPYIAYLQGGLSYSHTRYVLSEIIKAISSNS
ncbi:MAG: methionine gamma-lyase family protein [Candidatus Caenarcaniphilales bacterium]|nr:methionine gamma-lyase family protein [Candidatus Caenarcaniphilales bacterium]